MNDRYRLYGALGSPYAAKMRAILRYRHLPFDWVPADFYWAPDYTSPPPEIADVEPAIIPVLWFPHDGSYRTDSTVLAYHLEGLHSERSLIPDDPGQAFLSHLLEDMGDEWGVKMAFQLRWGNELDNEFTSRMVLGEILGFAADEATVTAAAKQFRDRQVGRMPYVGCTPYNAPLIEETYRRALDIVSMLPGTSPFFFGTRPGLADFGWYGALFTLSRDPTPGETMRRRSHATCRWVQLLDEASGVSGDWLDPSAPTPAPVMEMLRLAADVYLPFLQANEKAYREGEEMVNFSALGMPFEQGTFRYQVKCFQWLKDEYAALEGAPRERVTRVLDETGCLAALRG